MGLKPSKWNGTYAAVLLASHSTPTPCFRTLCLNLPVTNQGKSITTQKVLVTQSSNIVHCDWHAQKPVCADFQATSNTFSMFKLTFFSFFCQGGSVNSQKFHILLILSGKNALKWLELCILRVQGCLNPMEQDLSLYDKWFLKNQNLRQIFHILLILTGKNASKWLEWYIFRIQGVPNPMAQVSSLYVKWFLKNQNIRENFHIFKPF